jgi:hypothetical protein
MQRLYGRRQLHDGMLAACLTHHRTSQEMPKVAQPARGRAQGGAIERLVEHCAKGQADACANIWPGQRCCRHGGAAAIRWATGLTLTHQKEYQIARTVQLENTGACR